jgi:hypothetical protein
MEKLQQLEDKQNISDLLLFTHVSDMWVTPMERRIVAWRYVFF